MRGLDPGVELRRRNPHEPVQVPVEGPPGPGAEAEGALELVEEWLGPDHRREQYQAFGGEPAVRNVR